MARTRAKFTHANLTTFLKNRTSGQSLFDSEHKNLEARYRTSPHPHLSILTQMRIKGEKNPVSFKLGSFPEHEIAEIKEKYNHYRKLCLEGTDPRDIFEQQKKEEHKQKAILKQRQLTFEQVFEEYLKENEHLQKKTKQDMQNAFKRNLASVWHKPIKNITGTELKALIDTVNSSGKKYTAKNLMAYLNTLFNFAKGLLVNEEHEIYLIDLNPLDKLLNIKKKINKSLPQRQVMKTTPMVIRKLFDESFKISHPQYKGIFKGKEYMAILIELALFTGLRANELCRLKWENIHHEENKDDFIYPHLIAYNLKGDQDASKHYCSVIPLTKHLKAILERQYQYSGKISQWVFPSNNGKDALNQNDSKPMSSPYKNIRAISSYIKAPFSLHDLRRLFASIGSDLGYPEETIKRLLNHGISSVTQRYLHQIIPKSYEVYNKIHEEMLRTWDMDFLNT